MISFNRPPPNQASIPGWSFFFSRIMSSQGSYCLCKTEPCKPKALVTATILGWCDAVGAADNSSHLDLQTMWIEMVSKPLISVEQPYLSFQFLQFVIWCHKKSCSRWFFLVHVNYLDFVQETLTGQHLVEVSAAVQRGNTALQAPREGGLGSVHQLFGMQSLNGFQHHLGQLLAVPGLQAKHRWKFRRSFRDIGTVQKFVKARMQWIKTCFSFITFLLPHQETSILQIGFVFRYWNLNPLEDNWKPNAVYSEFSSR